MIVTREFPETREELTVWAIEWSDYRVPVYEFLVRDLMEKRDWDLDKGAYIVQANIDIDKWIDTIKEKFPDLVQHSIIDEPVSTTSPVSTKKSFRYAEYV